MTGFAGDHALHPQAAQHALALPARCYVEDEFERRERTTVFATGWQLVAHATQVAQPGDHVLAETAGVPLLIVRGEPESGAPQGRLRALHNVCRHRAGPIASCDGRAAKSLVCRYHGWTYALDGRLRGAPEMHEAPDFDPESIRLPQARVAKWQGLVFAALEESAPAFDEVVAGIGDRSGALDSYRFDRRVTRLMADHGLTALRLALGIVFLWFGVLKFFPGMSPAQDLAARTIETLTLGIVPPEIALPVLPAWECAIGIGLYLIVVVIEHVVMPWHDRRQAWT